MNVSGEDNRSNNWVHRIKRRPMTVRFNTSRKRKNLHGRNQRFPSLELIAGTVGQLGRMFGGTRTDMSRLSAMAFKTVIGTVSYRQFGVVSANPTYPAMPNLGMPSIEHDWHTQRIALHPRHGCPWSG